MPRHLLECFLSMTLLPGGSVTTLAGGGSTIGGFQDGAGAAARFNMPCGLVRRCRLNRSTLC